MAFGNHARDDVGVLLDLFTQQEKSGLGLVFGQHIEKALGETYVGAIIETEVQGIPCTRAGAKQP